VVGGYVKSGVLKQWHGSSQSNYNSRETQQITVMASMDFFAASLSLSSSQVCDRTVSGKGRKCYHDIVIFDKMVGFAFSHNSGTSSVLYWGVRDEFS